MADPSDYHSSTETPQQVTMAASDWALLEIGILQQIAMRLSDVADRVRVGRVCRRWRSAVSGDRSVMGRPWILARRGRRCWRSHAFMQLSHLHENVTAFSTDAAAVPATVDILGASSGWLAVRQRDRVVLTDVISPAKVSLPPFIPGYRIKNIFLSGDPFAAPAWTALAIAAVLNSSKDDVALAIFRRGDTRWALVHGDDVHAHPGRRYTSVEFHGGRAYAVDNMRREMVCVDDGAAAAAAVVTARTRIPQPLVDSYSACKTMQSSMAWLVECAGDLLLVQLEQYSLPRLRSCLCCACCPRRPRPGYLGLHLQVWRLRLAEDGIPASFLKTSMDIGDHALFVGDLGHAFAVQASGGLAGVRRNSVYYAGRMADTMVVFDIGTYRYEAVPYSRRRGVSVVGKWRPFCWFCPRRPVASVPSCRSAWSFV